MLTFSQYTNDCFNTVLCKQCGTSLFLDSFHCRVNSIYRLFCYGNSYRTAYHFLPSILSDNERVADARPNTWLLSFCVLQVSRKAVDKHAVHETKFIWPCIAADSQNFTTPQSGKSKAQIAQTKNAIVSNVFGSDFLCVFSEAFPTHFGNAHFHIYLVFVSHHC